METFSALLAFCARNSPHKGQWREALMCSLIYARINAWVSNHEAGDLRRYRAHYDVTVMTAMVLPIKLCTYPVNVNGFVASLLVPPGWIGLFAYQLNFASRLVEGGGNALSSPWSKSWRILLEATVLHVNWPNQMIFEWTYDNYTGNRCFNKLGRGTSSVSMYVLPLTDMTACKANPVTSFGL